MSYMGHISALDSGIAELTFDEMEFVNGVAVDWWGVAKTVGTIGAGAIAGGSAAISASGGLAAFVGGVAVVSGVVAVVAGRATLVEAVLQ